MLAQDERGAASSGTRATEPEAVTKDAEIPRDQAARDQPSRESPGRGARADRVTDQPSEAEVRRRRLASALRENLKRRKEQSRSRRTSDPV